MPGQEPQIPELCFDIGHVSQEVEMLCNLTLSSIVLHGSQQLHVPGSLETAKNPGGGLLPLSSVRWHFTCSSQPLLGRIAGTFFDKKISPLRSFTKARKAAMVISPPACT